MTEGEAARTGARKAHTWQSGLNNAERANSFNPATPLPKHEHENTTHMQGSETRSSRSSHAAENVGSNPTPASTLTIEGSRSKELVCPECGSNERLVKNGHRYGRKNEDIQRWLCKNCGHRFSETRLKGSDVSEHAQRIHRQILKTTSTYPSNCRVCVADGAMINLAEVESRIQEKAAGATKTQADIKGAIVSFAWYLKKNGYREITIHVATNNLTILHRRGADLFNPETVKETIANQKWSESYKLNMAAIYTLFLKMQGLTWQQPMYKPVEKFPFIPTEKEIDDLIAGCGKKTAAYLQLLKETGMRSGEADKLKWIDFDFERGVVSVTPEKNSKPRILKISIKCIAMLQNLPKTSDIVFGVTTINTKRSSLEHTRKILARKLNNPRLLQIHFHTLRHWKATMLYHQTKDPFYVKEFLGHKRLDTTQLYIQIEKALFKEMSDEFTVNVASEPEEIKKLLEVGFEYICEKDGLMFFRKRK